MKLVTNTYKSLLGSKTTEVTYIPRRKYTQWLIYQDNQPKYFVDFYDLEKESNAMMNSLVLCTQTDIEKVLDVINKKHRIRLSIPKKPTSMFQKKIETKVINLNLEPLPVQWLSYAH